MALKNFMKILCIALLFLFANEILFASGNGIDRERSLSSIDRCVSTDDFNKVDAVQWAREKNINLTLIQDFAKKSNMDIAPFIKSDLDFIQKINESVKDLDSENREKSKNSLKSAFCILSANISAYKDQLYYFHQKLSSDLDIKEGEKQYVEEVKKVLDMLIKEFISKKTSIIAVLQYEEDFQLLMHKSVKKKFYLLESINETLSDSLKKSTLYCNVM